MKSSLLAALFVAAIFSVPAQAEYSYVQVTRIGDDLYQTLDGLRSIQTRLCHEYVYSASATLDYDEFRYSGNKLSFDNGRVCEVVAVR